MTEEVEKMFAEVLAQRLGLHGSETSRAPAGDQIKTALALSLMQHFRSKSHDGEAVTIRRVAAIVGACPRCLGDDAGCAHCAGEGQPGYREPDRTALLEWIAAPLDRLGLRVSTRNRPPRHNHLGGKSQ